MAKNNDFLPVCREDMDKRGWSELDFLYISGDAYVDHPSFGHAIITRLLESMGFRVGIIPQPDWKSNSAFEIMGKPRLGVLISSGVIDSMVRHYTASKKVRSNDAYSPGGRGSLTPDRAVIVYANKVREVFKDTPVIIGGVEASLRRFAHYDYWDDKVRRSILLDSKADLLIYGMGEKPIIEIATLLERGVPISKINSVRGTCVVLKTPPEDTVELPSYEEVSTEKLKYSRAFKLEFEEQNPYDAKCLVQYSQSRAVVQNPPSLPMKTEELDKVYSFPYQRTYHHMYDQSGGVPAIEEVQFSITSHRGCLGGCAFCAINFLQGRIIQKRSQSSIMNEAAKLTWLPGFKGYIHDVGGPTANFRNAVCMKKDSAGPCRNRQCLYPTICKNLKVEHGEYLELLRNIRQIAGVKKVFIRSGIRYDYMLADKNEQFFKELVEYHTSGQLKVAPEHTSEKVLALMGKPSAKLYDRFSQRFYDINRQLNMEQYLVPYLLSSHPGSDLKAAVELAVYLHDTGCTPEQVQDFYPTPGSISTCMFYTGIDPRTMKEVHVPRSTAEKSMQRALLQYRKPANRELVKRALIEAGREDLIGYGKDCLIRPDRPYSRPNSALKGNSSMRKIQSNKLKRK